MTKPPTAIPAIAFTIYSNNNCGVIFPPFSKEPEGLAKEVDNPTKPFDGINPPALTYFFKNA
jgi:hypothetical protein